MMATSTQVRMIDIGVNLTDSMFQGHYNGKKVHESDFSAILERAFRTGVHKMIITGGNLEESRQALDLARTDKRLFSTVGVHPTRCKEFLHQPNEYMQNLKELIKEGKDKVVAVGEFGLDYDRLQFCDADVQKQYFERQFELAEESKLPLFLHMRSAAQDFVDIVSRNRSRFTKGVVHSFTGTWEEAKRMLDLDLFIGLNGCSLKTEENLEVVKNIPIDKIMIETDAPWCDIRNTHAGSKYVQTKFDAKDKKKFEMGKCVKGRNEPCSIIQVLEVIAGCKGMDPLILGEQFYQNTASVFFPNS